MTQADSTPAVLGRSLERDSEESPVSLPVPVPMYSPTIHGTQADHKRKPPEELPRGWRSFFSRQGEFRNEEELHWYATAPWSVNKIKERLGKAPGTVRDMSLKLSATVDAVTWDELKLKVEEQNRIYDFCVQDE